MNNKMDTLISAIESLKQETDWFGYVFQVCITVFTFSLGLLVAYLTFKWQKKHEVEKNKIDESNKLILNAYKASGILTGMKLNYCSRINNKPIERLLAVKYIPFNNQTIDTDIYGVAFLANLSKKKKSKKLKKNNHWENITKIHNLFSTYNHLINLWTKRNELILEFNKKIIIENVETGYQDISMELLMKKINGPELLKIVGLTEMVLTLTDATILELDKFSSEFPKVAKHHVDNNITKKYGYSGILSFSYKGDIYNQAIKLLPEADYKLVEKLYGKSAKDIKNLYSSPF